MTRALALAAAASVALSGCMTMAAMKDLSPDAKKEITLKFLDRCGGTVNIGASGGTGQMGGGVTGDFRVTGNCPVPTVIPLKDLGEGSPPFLTDENREAFNAWLAEKRAAPADPIADILSQIPDTSKEPPR